MPTPTDDISSDIISNLELFSTGKKNSKSNLFLSPNEGFLDIESNTNVNKIPLSEVKSYMN